MRFVFDATYENKQGEEEKHYEDTSVKTMGDKLWENYQNLPMKLAKKGKGYKDKTCFLCDLLIEYAPVFFVSFDDIKNDGENYGEMQMFKLVYLVIDFTLYVNIKHAQKSHAVNSVNELGYRHEFPYANKTQEEKEKAFKKHLATLYNFLGGNFSGYRKAHDFKEIIKDAYQNPKEYMLRDIKYSYSTRSIRDFLSQLRKRDTTNTFRNKDINSFLDEIEQSL